MKKVIISLVVLGTLIGGYFIIDGFLFDGIRAKEIKDHGFYGRYYSNNTGEQAPTVILIGGGYWGDYWASEFAKQGYVGLSLPYTREEGLPQLPEEIPLEYFAQAVNWLKTQDDVDPDHILVMGASKNSEIALSLAALYPKLVHGAIAYAPSSVSWSNTVLPFNSEELKPSLTFRDNDVPYVAMDRIVGNEGNKIDTYAYWNAGLEKDSLNLAAIRVEEISGPVLLFSGTEDEVWP
ncbi:MAG: alpha/beta hydrolase family protein, partial [Flavobacteriales bacterium]